MKFLILLTFLVSCAHQNNTTKDGELNNDFIIIPKSNVNSKNGVFFNTQKLQEKNVNGIKYELFYGSGGRYILRMSSLNGFVIDYKKIEASMFIDDKNEPETISFAMEDGLLTAFGSTKQGNIKLSLSVYMPESKDFSGINERIEIQGLIQDLN